MFVWYILLQLFFGYSCGTCKVTSRDKRVVLSHQYSPKHIITIIVILT